jgi:protein gp37
MTGWTPEGGIKDRAWMPRWPLLNVWVGTSIESDDYARRAKELRRAPAAIRFLSLEPLLGPLPSLDLTGIGWVIAGGESGPGFRPLDLAWVRDLRDRCGEEA